MKIKVKPEDFVVKEHIHLDLVEKGPYQLFLLKKIGANTLDVIRDLARKNSISPSEISYCGLKDRHAVSYQYITAPSGRIKARKGKNYEAIPVGYMERPIDRKDILYNSFKITVRDVGLPDELVEAEISLVNKYGLFNYYDEQRMGSARHGKGFAAKEILKKNYKKALKLLIATPSKWDEKEIKKFRKCLSENWGKWEKCLELAPTSWEKKILEFLNQREFSTSTAKRAVSMVDRIYMELCFNAYQAYIWNKTLEKLILKRLSEDELIKVPYLYGFFYFYKEPDQSVFEFFKGLEIPTVSPKLPLEGEVGEAISQVLKEEGFADISELKSKIRGAIFRSHKRSALVFPEIKHSVELDEIYTGKKKWLLEFDLPAGSYATLVVKRIFYREISY